MSKRTHYPPGPFVFMDLLSTRLTEEERKLLSHRLLAGIVLFARNYESPEQLAQLLCEMRSINPHLLFAVDQEGGRVQRFKEPFTRLPAMKQLGNLYLLDEEKGKQLTHDAAWLVGSELAAFGIHINFAPVLDLDLACNDVIADRAFGQLAQLVTTLGQAYVQGIASTSVLPVAKHFPGHGGVYLDSHVAQPIDERSFDTLWEGDMKPFRSIPLPAMMVSHVIYSAVSPMPAGYCRFWLNAVLRDKMHSDAFIFSDCLSMKAAQVGGNAVKRICLAYGAGCHYVLLCNHTEESQWNVLEALEDEIVSNEMMTRLPSYHSSLSFPFSVAESLEHWHQLQSTEKYQRVRHDVEGVK